MLPPHLPALDLENANAASVDVCHWSPLRRASTTPELRWQAATVGALAARCAAAQGAGQPLAEFMSFPHGFAFKERPLES